MSLPPADTPRHSVRGGGLPMPVIRRELFNGRIIHGREEQYREPHEVRAELTRVESQELLASLTPQLHAWLAKARRSAKATSVPAAAASPSRELRGELSHPLFAHLCEH